MKQIIDWPYLEHAMDDRGLEDLSIANGQHIIDLEGMVIGHVSTPIGGEPSWIFYDNPAYEAGENLVSKTIRISTTSLLGDLFQATTINTPPFKTSTDLESMLKNSPSLQANEAEDDRE